MRYRNYKKAKPKDHFNKCYKSKKEQKNNDEMKSAKNDEKRLKRKKKRLSIDWFFRPEGD
jgi:hypothetical protein